MTKLTDLEFKGLQGVYNSDYRDGENPVGKPVWTWSCNPFNSKRTFSGVVASLVKKGLVVSDQDPNPDECCLTMTMAGYDAYLAHKNATPRTTNTEEPTTSHHNLGDGWYADWTKARPGIGTSVPAINEVMTIHNPDKGVRIDLPADSLNLLRTILAVSESN